MTLLTRIVHVVALGLWFGSAMFFTFVVGLTLFATFETIASRPKEERPLWLPLPSAFDQPRPSERFPDPLRKEQGTRIAGAAVGPMFPWYFAIQSLCGAVALVTALTWARIGSRVALVHKIRTVVLLAAVTTVAVGWWLEDVIHHLTEERNQATDAVLTKSQPAEAELQKADRLRAEFGPMHGYSMVLNLLTVVLVGVAMGLAGVLPDREPGMPAKV